MTSKERAAMQQALEALEEIFHSNSTKVAVEKYNIAHNALREALAEQAEQEPAGTAGELFTMSALERLDVRPSTKVYLNTAPVRTKDHCNPLQDLTNDDIEAIRMGIIAYEPTGYGRVFARAVIAAYKEKNK